MKIEIEAPAAERRVMNHLVSAWNEFLELPNRRQDETAEFLDAFHRLQTVILTRVGRDVMNGCAEGTGGPE